MNKSYVSFYYVNLLLPSLGTCILQGILILIYFVRITTMFYLFYFVAVHITTFCFFLLLSTRIIKQLTKIIWIIRINSVRQFFLFTTQCFLLYIVRLTSFDKFQTNTIDAMPFVRGGKFFAFKNMP